MSDESEVVTCPTHGESHATFVCRHLANGENAGFCSADDTDDPRPDAWCGACDEVLRREEGWNDVSEAFAAVTVICAGCYDAIRDERSGPAGLKGIIAHLGSRYPDAEPVLTELDLQLAEGTLPACVYSFRVADHWHLAACGLSELEEKTTDRPDVSGFGIELSLRVSGPPGTPPDWAVRLLHQLMEYVYRTAHPFAAGHHVDLKAPIAPNTDFTALIFAEDRTLCEATTPNGRLRYLQAYPVTRDELKTAEDWDSRALTEILRKKTPHLIADLRRSSALSDPQIAAEVARRRESEGSTMSATLSDTLMWMPKGSRAVLMVLGRATVSSIPTMVEGRLLRGKEFEILNRETRVLFRPASADAWKIDKGALVVDLKPDTARKIAGSVPSGGDAQWPELPGFTLRVK